LTYNNIKNIIDRTVGHNNINYFKSKAAGGKGMNEFLVEIDTGKCMVCGGCIDLCPSVAISMINDVVVIDPELCTKCGICIKVCPVRAPKKVE
jgi:ferredoxin